MRLRTAIFGAAIAACAAGGIVKLASYGPVLQINKAQWLANQGKWDEARAQLRSHTAGKDDRARLLLVLILLNSDRAGLASEWTSVLPDSAEGHFLRGATAYLLDREAEAVEDFAKALKSPGELEGWMGEIAQMAAGLASPGEPGESGAAGIPADDGWRDAPLERLLWNAFTGRAYYRAGEYDRSRRHLATAIAAQDTNIKTWVLAAAANALSGDYPAAMHIADRASSRTEFLKSVAGEADRLSSTATALTAPSLPEAVRSEVLRLNARRAGVWTRLAQAWTDGTTLESALAAAGDLARERPGDPVAGVLHGEALEADGRLADAYRQYAAVYERAPSYPALLRMRDLSGPSPESRQRKAEFLRGPQVIAHIPTESMQTTGTFRRRDALAFLEPSSASAEFSVPKNGRYQIGLTAAGDRAFGLGPVAAVWLDGRKAGEIYISRDGWDFYSLRAHLTAGTHKVTVEYVNDAERRPSAAQDRNLYLEDVLITRIGGS